MFDKKSINLSDRDTISPQTIDSLHDLDQNSPDEPELSLHGLAAQLKNIITQSRMDRAKRKPERKTGSPQF